MNLQTEASGWFILLCLLLALGYAGGLYLKDTLFSDTDVGEEAEPRWLPQNRWVYLMAALRFVVVFFIAYLLLSPLVKTYFKEVQDPIILLAHDHSESVRYGFMQEGAQEVDSAQLSRYREEVHGLTERLQSRYDVHTYQFGQSVNRELSFAFDHKQTDMASVFQTFYDRYVNRNVGAIILAGDGIYNKGANPRYGGQQLQVPVYTVALGDTTPRKDLLIEQVRHNELVYLGNDFPLHINWIARHCEDGQTMLTVSRVSGDEEKEVARKQLSIRQAYEEAEETIILTASETGMQHYRIRIEPVAQEITTANNVRDIFVEVLDSRRKILLLAHSPHPDLGALRQAITENEHYEVEVQYAKDGVKAPEAYHLMVLHQLPSDNHPVPEVLRVARNHNIPLFFVVGQQTNIPSLNQAQDVVHIQQKSSSPNEVQGVAESLFSLFTVSDETLEQIVRFPPLRAPFGNFKTGGAGAQVMMRQRIGQVETDYPLMAFAQRDGRKTGILCAEGIWRWRLHDYANTQTHDATNELIGKTVQYLSARADKRRFRVSMPQPVLNENEPVQFRGELYNESFELVNEPEAGLTIYDSEGKAFSFTFSRTTNAYRLEAGTYPAGEYTYEAEVRLGQQTFKQSGRFTVRPMRIEAIQTIANHNLLYQLARQSGGQLFYPGQLDKLEAALYDQDAIRPVSHYNHRTQALINLKWVFFLILALLTTEWFFRKWLGGY